MSVSSNAETLALGLSMLHGRAKGTAEGFTGLVVSFGVVRCLHRTGALQLWA
jgi:hypothetical protein